MESRDYLLIFGEALQDFDGLPRPFDDDLDAFRFDIRDGLFRYFQHAERAGPYDETFRMGGDRIPDVVYVKGMSFFSPPAGIDTIGVNDDIGRVGNAVNDNCAP